MFSPTWSAELKEFIGNVQTTYSDTLSIACTFTCMYMYMVGGYS